MKLNQFSLLSFGFIFFLSACSPSFDSQLEKGKKFYAEKNYIQAIDALNMGIPKWKSSDGPEKQGEAYQLLGKSYHAISNIDRAADAYKQALKVSDKAFDAAYSLGLIYLTSKQSQQALATFRTALQIKPDDPIALIGLGNTYYELADYANAYQVYQRVLDVSPGVRDAIQYSNLAKEKMRRRTTARAVRSFAKEAQKKPSNARVQKNSSPKKKR